MTNTDKTVSTERRKDIADALEDMAETLGLAKGHRSILQSASAALREASRTQEPADEATVAKIAYSLSMHKGLRMTVAQLEWLEVAVAEALRAASITPPAPETSEPVAWVTKDILAAMKRGERAVPGWKPSADFCIPLYAATPPAPERSKEGLGVKALNWGEHNGYHADSVIGTYHVRHDGDEPEEWSWSRNGGMHHYFETQAEAQAAAQADYEQRILSALEPSPIHKGEVIPRLPNCGKYLAQDNAGNWHYLNHAGTWQGFQGPQEAERCFICNEPFKAGEMVLSDVTEGLGHRACFGEDREGYVNLQTGEPIGADEPIPTGWPYEPEAPPHPVTISPEEGVRDADLIKMAKAHDKEEAAQMGEMSPWDAHGIDLDPDWVEGRIVAMRCAVAALSVKPGERG